MKSRYVYSCLAQIISLMLTIIFVGENNRHVLKIDSSGDYECVDH